MNRRYRLAAGPILCMLALFAVQAARGAQGAADSGAGSVIVTTAAAEDAGASGTASVTAAAAEGEMAFDSRNLAMDVTYGYGNRAKGGRYVPVDVTIFNQGDMEFAGKLRLLTMEADYDIYRYEYPVTVPAKEDSGSAASIPAGGSPNIVETAGATRNAAGDSAANVQAGGNLDIAETSGANPSGATRNVVGDGAANIQAGGNPGAAGADPAGENRDTAGILRKHIYVPMGSRADRMFVSLTDEEGNLILNKRVNLDFGVDVPELFIGALTDSPGMLDAWDGIGVDYSMLRTEVVRFNTETFPEDEMGLDMIDVLLVSNFRIRDLSAEQNQVLVEWVRSGGTMILGTGERADDTLGRFAPELLEESYDPPVTREVDMGDQYTQDNPGDATLTIPCLEFSLSGGDVLFSDEQQALVASVSYGKGTIAVAAYDFADIADFCSRNPAYLDDLLTAVLGESRLSGLAEEVYSGNSDQYWSARDMIDTGDVRRLPNMNLYTLELAIYLLLAGLVVYIFLKQRDLTDYYRGAVVVLSLLFTAIIYVMGSKTRFTGTFYSYAQFLETTFDSVSETSYVNIRAPYNRPYQARVPAAYSIKPVTRSYYSEESVPSFTGGESPRVEISFEPEETVISIQDVPAFEPRYFQMKKVTENTESVGFDGDIGIDGGKLTGSVTNLFPETVYDCVLLFNQKLVRLGDLEAGQTAELEGLEALEYPKNASYQVAAYLSGESAFQQADISDENYVRATQKSDTLCFYLDNQMPYFAVPGARIVGFMNLDGENDGSASKAQGGDGITVVSSSVAVYASDDTVLYRSALVKTPRVLGGSYDSAANALYGIDPVTLEYSVGTDVQVEKLTFDYVSKVFTDQEGSNLAVFEGTIYFYNHLTGVYDKMDSEKMEYGAHELLPYLTDDNRITVRYVYGNINQYNWNVLLPMLNIVGREY